MTPLLSRDEILNGLIIDIAECVACEQEDITPEASFFNSLGGESIDILDLSFRIRERFGIEANFQELLSSWEFDSNGQLSSDTVDRLREKYPAIDWTTRTASLSGQDPRDLLTVDLIVELLFYAQSKDGVSLSQRRK